MPPAACVTVAALILIGRFASVDNSFTGPMLLLRYSYMVLLVLLGWRLLVRRHMSFGFFVGILLDAVLFKAVLLTPGRNYAVRMAVYYGGCLSESAWSCRRCNEHEV